jgi:hypothetical protein
MATKEVEEEGSHLYQGCDDDDGRRKRRKRRSRKRRKTRVRGNAALHLRSLPRPSDGTAQRRRRSLQTLRFIVAPGRNKRNVGGLIERNEHQGFDGTK